MTLDQEMHTTGFRADELCVKCRYQGHVSAALVLGGVDFKGPHLFTVSCRAVLPLTSVKSPLP